MNQVRLRSHKRTGLVIFHIKIEGEKSFKIQFPVRFTQQVPFTPQGLHAIVIALHFLEMINETCLACEYL